jgi:predicted  nucleic acid-binding Zn-ribbon protein
VEDLNNKFLEKEQRITDLERKLKEKEQELKEKDFQMNNLGYKQRYEQAQEQKMEAQQALRDTRQRCRELEMLVNKYEEKTKQLKHQLLQSREDSTRSLTAALQAQGYLGLGQQQLDRSLSLLSEPIDEFNVTPESAGIAALDQRVKKRARET